MEKKIWIKGLIQEKWKKQIKKNGLDIDLTSILQYFQQCKNEVCTYRNGYPSFMFSLKTPLYTYSFI